MNLRHMNLPFEDVTVSFVLVESMRVNDVIGSIFFGTFSFIHFFNLSILTPSSR
jgi:hypothetical protein